MTTPPEELRDRDWLDDILNPDPAPAPSSGTPTAPYPDRAEDDDTGAARLRGRLRSLFHATPAAPTAPEQPGPSACGHARTVPVHSHPYGELVALLCQDCDAQLPLPGEEPAQPEPARPPAAPPPPPVPAETAPTAHKPEPQPRYQLLAGQSHLRAIAFSGTAAAAGYSLGLVQVLGAVLPAADHGSTGALGALLAPPAAYGTWRLLGRPVLAPFLPYGMVSRIVATVVVACAAPGIAPGTVALIAQHGRVVGLGPSAVALLLTAAAMCGGLYWAIDRRFRAMWWPVRWLTRIPLASAILAVALYSPGPR
ncbi:hypothetical protein ACIQMP_07825 [Streptomyces sp. NPDC091385]|uniref:hypothetical protein n=1 Tax=Streptomyces sp. NPDC091385 TaxID=3365997 RepID=UPI0037F6F06D